MIYINFNYKKLHILILVGDGGIGNLPLIFFVFVKYLIEDKSFRI